MSSNDLIDLPVEMRRETEKAYLFFDGVDEIWIPKSQIKAMEMRDGEPIEISIPEWLAAEKGLI